MKEENGGICLNGVFPALLTPISDLGKIKKQGVRQLISWELSKGADGFYIGGATGECYTMETSAREELAQIALEAMEGRGKAIIHIGSYSAASGVRLARQAQRLGADAISATPPPVYRYGVDELVEYYRILAESVTLPVIVYINSMLGDCDAVEVMERLLEIPNVAGAKFTQNAYYNLFRLSKLKNGGLLLLNGPDETFLCGLVMGACGGIGSTYNIMPGIYQKIFRAFQERDMETAIQWQRKASEIVGILLKFGQIQAMKYLFARKGIDLGKAQPPARELSLEEKKALVMELKAAGYFSEYPDME